MGSFYLPKREFRLQVHRRFLLSLDLVETFEFDLLSRPSRRRPKHEG